MLTALDTKLSLRVFDKKQAIIAPDIIDDRLQVLVENLRKSGEAVIINLSEKNLNRKALEDLNCDRHIVNEDGSWKVKPI